MTNKVFCIPSLLECKDAADVDLSREVYWYHEHLPNDIDFLLLSGDGFIAEIQASIILERNVLLPSPRDGKFFEQSNFLVKRISLGEKPLYYKPSRLSKFHRETDLCKEMNDNGLPCRFPRWEKSDKCYKHL